MTIYDQPSLWSVCQQIGKFGFGESALRIFHENLEFFSTAMCARYGIGDFANNLARCGAKGCDALQKDCTVAVVKKFYRLRQLLLR